MNITKTTTFSQFKYDGLGNAQQPGVGNEDGVYLVGYRKTGNNMPEVRIPINKIAAATVEGVCNIYVRMQKTEQNVRSFTFNDQFGQILDTNAFIKTINDAVSNSKFIVCYLYHDEFERPDNLGNDTNTLLTLTDIDAGNQYIFSGVQKESDDITCIYHLIISNYHKTAEWSVIFDRKTIGSGNTVKWEDIQEKPAYIDIVETGSYYKLKDIPLLATPFIYQVFVEGSNIPETVSGHELYRFIGKQTWTAYNPTSKSSIIQKNIPVFEDQYVEVLDNIDIVNKANNKAVGAFGVLDNTIVKFYAEQEPDSEKQYVFTVKAYGIEPVMTDITIDPDEPGGGDEPGGSDEPGGGDEPVPVNPDEPINIFKTEVSKNLNESSNFFPNNITTLTHEVPDGYNYPENSSISSNNTYYVVFTGEHNGKDRIFIPNNYEIDNFYIYGVGWLKMAGEPGRLFQKQGFAGNINGEYKSFTLYTFRDPRSWDAWNIDREHYSNFNSSTVCISFTVSPVNNAQQEDIITTEQ